MKAFFRGLAAAFPAEAPAQAVAGVLLLALSLYTGYQIPRKEMIGALRWISYINVRPLKSPTSPSDILNLGFGAFTADILGIRGTHGERISYPEWSLFKPRPFWARVRGYIDRKSSLSDRWC
jgi:hypothetical protein